MKIFFILILESAQMLTLNCAPVPLDFNRSASVLGFVWRSDAAGKRPVTKVVLNSFVIQVMDSIFQ